MVRVWTWTLGALGVLASASCSRVNPAYEGGEGGDVSGDGGATTSVASGDATATSIGSASASGTGLDTTDGSGSSGVAAECGNGTVEEGEDCDDGNLEDDATCTPDCRIPGEPEWRVEVHPQIGPNRYNASALHQGDLIAVGRVRLNIGAPYEAVVSRLALEDGTQRSHGYLEGAWQRSEALAVHEDGAQLYISGDAQADSGEFRGLVARFEVSDPDVPPSTAWESPTQIGTTSRAIDIVPEGLAFSLGAFMDAGYGMGSMALDATPLPFVYSPAPEGTARLDVLEQVGGELVVGGMLNQQAYGATVSFAPASLFTTLLLDGTAPGPDRVQGIVNTDGAMVVAGYFTNQNTGRDAFVGRYTMLGDSAWQMQTDAGNGDEVEDITLDGAGNIIAVGFTGDATTTIPTVWKLDVGMGTEIWQRSYPELTDSSPSYFRGVEVAGDIFVVGELGVGGDDSRALAMRLAL